MTKAEENILNKLVTQVAVMNTNFDNHIEADVKHREYMKKKMCMIEEKLESVDNLNIAVFGTDVEKHQDGLVGKGNAHIENHGKNEEKWGFQLYLRNHLKVFVAIIILSILALGYVGINIENIAQAGLKSIGVKIDLPVKEK